MTEVNTRVIPEAQRSREALQQRYPKTSSTQGSSHRSPAVCPHSWARKKETSLDLIQRLHFGGAPDGSAQLREAPPAHLHPGIGGPTPALSQPLCPPCCCTPLRSSPAPGGTACRAGRSSSWRTRSKAPHICRSPSASRAATWLGRGGRGPGPGNLRRGPAGANGEAERGEAQRGPRDGERRRHGTAPWVSGSGEGSARLGPRGGGRERGGPGSAAGPGPDPAAAAALRPFGTRPLTQRERKPRGEPRPLRAGWMP